MATPSQIRSAVETYFDVVPGRSTAEELVFICPEPGCGDSSGNRSVNLKTGVTSCWRCNRAGPLYKWAKRLGYEIEYDEAPVPTLGELDSLLDELDRPVTRPTGYVPEVSLPRGFTYLSDQPDCGYAQLIERMAHRKNLDLSDFITARAGFTRTDPLWEPFCIFPTFEWGRPVYYQGRTYVDPDEGSTKRFPTRRECPMSSRYWVYNIDELAAYGKIAIVVESVLNVLSLKKELSRRGLPREIVPVCVFKHSVSKFQLKKILAAPHLEEVCFMYDSDATDQAFAHAANFMNHLKVSVAEMTDNVDANDDAAKAVDTFLRRQPASSRIVRVVL